MFWDMHLAIYANGHRLSSVTLFAIASHLGLDVAELRLALEQGTYAPKVEADSLGGIRSGVNGTPCFFVNGRRHDGSYAAPDLTAAIDAARQKGPARNIPIRA